MWNEGNFDELYRLNVILHLSQVNIFNAAFGSDISLFHPDLFLKNKSITSEIWETNKYLGIFFRLLHLSPILHKL